MVDAYEAAMTEACDPMLLLQRVTDRTLDLVPAADGVMVGVADDHGVSYVCGAGQCMSFLGTRVDLDSSLSGITVRTGEVQRSDDTSRDPRVDADACRRLSVASLVCIPLCRRGEVLGVLAVNAASPNAFGVEDLEELCHLAEFMGVVVGSAWDLALVSRQVLASAPDDDVVAPLTAPSARADVASRFMMSVLRPDTVDFLDARRRIRAVLVDPQALSIVFQPIVDLDAGLVAVEALSRFAGDPARTPDRWFAEAHRVGLGVELELLAIERAVALLDDLPDGVDLNINAGPATLVAPELGDLLRGAVARRVVLELTEHTHIEDYPELAAALWALRRTGVRIAVDDAGSGYASLTHILKLAPDFIKLDRELITDIDLDPVRRALAASLVTFADDTGARILAEGIETPGELETVHRLGVRYAQGYHLGRPAPIETLAELEIGSVTSTRR
jgi:EAL domain-containing protein (putative c-di-GMP-specific phosphodiesterase class I)